MHWFLCPHDVAALPFSGQPVKELIPEVRNRLGKPALAPGGHKTQHTNNNNGSGGGSSNKPSGGFAKKGPRPNGGAARQGAPSQGSKKGESAEGEGGSGSWKLDDWQGLAPDGLHASVVMVCVSRRGEGGGAGAEEGHPSSGQDHLRRRRRVRPSEVVWRDSAG